MAATIGNIEIVKALIKADADVNQSDNEGTTPLHVAASKGYKDLVKALIGADADVNQSDNEGTTPLHVAASKGYKDLVKALIGADADVNQSDNEGKTPLHVAASKGYKKIEKIFLKESYKKMFLESPRGFIKKYNEEDPMPISLENLKEVVDAKKQPVAILFGDPCKAIYLKTYLDDALKERPQNPLTRDPVSKADIITISVKEYAKVLDNSASQPGLNNMGKRG